MNFQINDLVAIARPAQNHDRYANHTGTIKRAFKTKSLKSYEVELRTGELVRFGAKEISPVSPKTPSQMQAANPLLIKRPQTGSYYGASPVPSTPQSAKGREFASVLGIAAAPAPTSAQTLLNRLKSRGISLEVELCNEGGREVQRFTATGGVMLTRDWEELRRFKGAILAEMGAAT